MKGTVYLLHFEAPYRHARHYLGFTMDLTARLEEHARGGGARLMAVIAAAGIGFQLARTWVGSRSLERKIKKRKESPALCPLCNSGALRLARA